jgi:hypothetical protein
MEKPQQLTLDHVVLEQLQKGLQEVQAQIKELSERVSKLEADTGVSEIGLNEIYRTLELHGLMQDGEPVEVAKKEPTTVSETTFTILEWDPLQGAKIGPYDVAYKASNLEDKWASAFNILRQSNSTIKNRYHGQGYGHTYWLYNGGKIYRQQLKGAD